MTATATESALAPEPRLYTVVDAMRLLSLSRSVLYEQIRAGRLRTVHQGRACRITHSAVRDYINLLEKEAEAR